VEIIGVCWHCRAPLTASDYGRETLCRGCGKPTRVCRNCGNYAPGRPADCLEPLAERVLEKGRATACEFFAPAANPLADPAASAGGLRAAAEALFRS